MVTFVTTNPGKLREAREYLDEPVEQLEFDYLEPQADSLATVAAHGARQAYRRVEGPVIVDDSGLTIDAFDGFPGPYSSYVERRVGIGRVADLAGMAETRAAAFRCAVAYCDGEAFAATPESAAERDAVTADEGPPVKLFEGVVPGTIVQPRGDGGFGYDPIFEHDGQTFAEMDTEAKNAVSHRGRALAEFAEWYATR